MSQAVGLPQIELEEPGTGIKIEININGLQTAESHDNPPDSPSFKAKRKNKKNPAADSDKAYSAASKVEQMKSLFQRFRMAISPRSSTESLARSEKSEDSDPGTPRISPTSSARGSSLNVKDGGSKGHSSNHSLSGSGSIIDLMRRKSVSKKKEEKAISIDELIRRLKENDGHFQECSLSIEEITHVCKEARELLLSQPVLLELSGPIHVCGDIHGQFTDLIDLFLLCGDPSDSNYLFLGDYVDRGKQSLETILLLLCYKIKYPTTFFLLRGNHECSSINRAYGFYDECKRRAQVKVWKTFVEVFEVLPLAAIISDKIFCVHGGISPTLHDMNDIREIERPLDIQGSGLESDLLWSDPSEDVELWELNDARGVSFLFGPPQVDNFLKRFNFDLIVRAHMVVEDGYEFFHDRKLVTIFSAPNYCGQYDNHGGILHVDQELKVQFKFLIPRDDVDRKSLVRPKNRELYPRRSEQNDDH